MTTKECEIVKRDDEDTTDVMTTESTYTPAVDIREDADAISLAADMPGVDAKTVDVNVENNVLKIEGRVKQEAPAGYELVGREYDIGRYRRDFTLSEEIDVEGIKAKVKDGVLRVTLPRRGTAKPRKIKIAS